MLGAGAVLSTPAFAAGNDVGGKSKSGGVKRFEFGEDGTFTSLGNLFVDYDVPELTGVGTGVVPVFVRGAAKPSFKIFVADSGDCPKRDASGRLVRNLGSDNPHADQIAWYLRESADGVPHIWIQHIIVPDVKCNGLFLPAKDGEGIKEPFFMPDGSKKRMKLAPGVAGACREVTCPFLRRRRPRPPCL